MECLGVRLPAPCCARVELPAGMDFSAPAEQGGPEQ